MNKVMYLMLLVALTPMTSSAQPGRNIDSSQLEIERSALIFRGALEGFELKVDTEFQNAYSKAVAIHWDRSCLPYAPYNSELTIDETELVWDASPFTNGTRFYWWNKNGFEATRSYGIRVTEGQWGPVLDYGFRGDSPEELIHRFGPLVAIPENIPEDTLTVYNLEEVSQNCRLAKWLDRVPEYTAGRTAPDETELVSLANLDLDDEPEMLVRYGYNHGGGLELFILYDWQDGHYVAISSYDVVYY